MFVWSTKQSSDSVQQGCQSFSKIRALGFTEEMRFHGFHGLRDNETVRAQKTQPPSSGSEEQIRILIEGKDYIIKIPVAPLFEGSLQFNLN